MLRCGTHPHLLAGSVSTTGSSMEWSICLYLSKLSPTSIKSRNNELTNYKDMFTVSCLTSALFEHQTPTEWPVVCDAGSGEGQSRTGCNRPGLAWTDTSYNERSVITLGLVIGHQASQSGHCVPSATSDSKNPLLCFLH